MFILFTANKRIFLTLGLLLVLLLWASTARTALTVTAAGTADAAETFLTMHMETASRTDEGTVNVFIGIEVPAGIYDAAWHADGTSILAAALQCSLSVTEGWRVGKVAAYEETAGFTVTVGGEDGILRLLLDGHGDCFHIGGAEGVEKPLVVRLLRVTLISVSSADGEGDPPLRLEDGGRFYYMDGNRAIYDLPIRASEFSTGEGEKTARSLSVKVEKYSC